MRYWQCLCLVIVAFAGYAQVPEVRNVEPNNGFPGQIINVQGTNFNNSSEVRFGGVLGTVVSRSGQLIEVEVPAGATFDNISVLNTSSNRAGHAPLPYVMSFGGTPGLAAGDFENQIDFPTGPGLFDLCMCDLDGDGLNDITSANSNASQASIFLNQSTSGNFSFPSAIPQGRENTLNVACGDLNGDTQPELVFSVDKSSELRILVNNSTPGNLSFSETTINLTGVRTKRVVIRDINGDGRPEIIGSDLANPQIYIIQNNSSGGTLNLSNTPLEISVNSAQNTSALEVIDMNGDSKPDIIVDQFVDGNGGFFVALNKGTGNSIQFDPFQRYDLNAPVVLKVADLNGDRKPDVILPQFLNNGQVAVLLNQTSTVGGSVTFASPLNVPTNGRPWGLDLADFDGDGKEDMIVGTLDAGTTAISVLRNTTTSGTVSFQRLDIGVNSPNRNVAAGDLNGDGRPDIAITSTNNNVSILLNKKCLIPVIDPAEDLSLCAGNTKTLRTQKVDGVTYDWQVGGSLLGSDPFFETTLPGVYTVTIRDGICNETSDPITVNIGAAPGGYSSPAFTSPTGPVCIGSDLNLVMSDAAYDYVWRGPEGFSETGRSVTLNNFQFENSGVYEVDVSVGGCVVETLNTTVEAVPAPEFSVSTSVSGPVCQGQPVELSVSPAGNTSFDYLWFDESGSTGVTAPTFQPTTSGEYSVQATDNTGMGCNAIRSPAASVLILAPPQVDFDLPSSSCVNSTIAFSNNSIVDANANVEYSWDFGDGSISTNPDPLHTYASASDYSVELTVSYEGAGCGETRTKPIQILPGLDVIIVAEPEVVCEGGAVELSTETTYESYTWDTGETSSTITVTNAGNFGVSVTDVNGCQGFAQISLNTFPQPIVEVTAEETNVAPGQEVQLNATGLVSYSWTPAELLDDPNSSSPIATVDVPTTFEVSGLDVNGCPGDGSIQIFTGGDLIGQLLDPKNFFSPNKEDNINATWTVEGILEFPQCQVTIYDQTGNVLFEAQPYMNDWDGTSGGRDLPNGVYYYTINCGGKELAKSGSITLLR